MINWPWMSHAHARVPILKEMQRRIDAGLTLTGKTTPCRRAIRELGGMWDEVHCCWLMPNEESLKELGAVKTDDGWRLPTHKENQNE